MFLEVLAKHILSSKGKKLADECFVFPNRRSGLFFKRFLIKHALDTQWIPEIKTINEFMQELSGLQLADPLDLLFEIYNIYESIATQPEPFDDFYPWGEMMLNDYDSLDKYLVDPGSIFKNIHDLKEIDEKFGGLEEEQIEFIKKFWRSFHQGEMTNEKEIFLTTWKLLPKIYFALNKNLEEKGEAYEGLIYRKVAEMEMNELAVKLGSDHYHFIGFNALSLTEKRLFNKLKNRNLASFYWDYDEAYIMDESMEAGRFLRDNLMQFPPPVDLSIFSTLRDEKKIRIFDLPSDVLQAKTVYKLLSERKDIVVEANDTAIIACDETLLMPILVSLPEQVDLVNITMGYPFSNTPLNSFIDGIFSLHKNARRKQEGSVKFYYKDVLSVLNHQYFKLLTQSAASDIIKQINYENRVYIESSFFQNNTYDIVFKDVKKVADLCAYLERLLLHILKSLSDEAEHQYRELEKEYVLVMLSKLNKLKQVSQKQKDIKLDTFIRLFRRIMSNQRIPFTGEPLAGIQIMGILETRLLDFENIIMLSVNEDIMPRSTVGHSFIPYSLRYAYGLPTREDMDAIYAYYFYRVIQRAGKVDLLFKSASEGVRSGEMSRYLYQMKYDYNAEIIRPSIVLSAPKKIPIIIKKTPEILSYLDKYLEGNENDRYLSPSALNTYIECSLKFYFRKIANIKEEDELLEELDPIGFGNILHKTIEILYEELSKVKKLISREEFQSLLSGKLLDAALTTTFNKEFYKSAKSREIEGRNLIIYSILKKYLIKIIETDMALSPIEILDLEKNFEMRRQISAKNGNATIRLGGKVDRLDRLSNGLVRIIDYKTGNSGTGFESIESLFESSNSNRNKEAFQAFVYASLFLDKYPGQQVQPGLYIVRNLFGENYSPQFQMGSAGKKQAVESFNEHLEEFSLKLTHLISEIFNPDLPFEQTEITERCKYCDFKDICERT